MHIFRQQKRLDIIQPCIVHIFSILRQPHCYSYFIFNIVIQIVQIFFYSVFVRYVIAAWRQAVKLDISQFAIFKTYSKRQVAHIEAVVVVYVISIRHIQPGTANADLIIKINTAASIAFS